LLTRVPKSAQTLVATLVRSIFAQTDQEAVWAQHGRIVEQLQERFPEAAQLLAEAGPDVPSPRTSVSLPTRHQRRYTSLLWQLNDLRVVLPNDYGNACVLVLRLPVSRMI
jgi:putative transposase